jgi:uncharacterized membrane-anchored protein YjiN (DUF445 family)
MQQSLPQVLDFVGQEQIAGFIQSNSVQWVRNTQINNLASEMLRAVLDNDFHQDLLQHGLDLAHDWVTFHPEQTRELTQRIFQELGYGKLPKAFTGSGLICSNA